MIVLAKQRDVDEILAYLKKDVENCIYMYIDIAKYGLSNHSIRIWIDRDSTKINCVVMQYHLSVSIYSDMDEYDWNEVVKLVRTLNVKTLNGKKEDVIKIKTLMGLKDSSLSSGYVFSLCNFKQFDIDRNIEKACNKDFEAIAALIVQDDDFGAMYNINDLAMQLRERANTNMGRSYIIKKDEEIIAHIASYAEYNHIATTSGLIVRKDCRDSNYGFALEQFLIKDLIQDGFDVYTFVTEKKRKMLLELIGEKLIGYYAKIVF